MPFIDFSVVYKKKKSKGNTKSNSKRIKEWTIVEKNVEGIVGFTDDLQYIIMTKDGRDYLIDKSCYHCKGYRKIYSQILFGEYLQCCIIERIKDDSKNHFPYLPFAIGCVVIGNIVKNNINNLETFIIKKCDRDYENPDAIHVIKTFREIYNKDIEEKIIANYMKIIDEEF